MLKIYLTQLTGIYKKIEQNEQDNMEDAARLLAQALVSHGTVYLHGFKEMEGIISQALEGPEPIKGLKRLYSGQYMAQVQQRDRAIIFARSATEPEAVALAESLTGQRIPFVAVSQAPSADEADIPNLANLADIHIDIKATRGLIPNEDGTRSGVPTLAAALFVYQGITLAIDEIIKEYEDE